MIKSFKHKGLIKLFERGSSRRIRHDLQSRSLRRLEALDQAESLTDLNVPGFNFHGLQGMPKRYSYMLTAHGVLHLSGKRVRSLGSILNNITEVQSWENILLSVL